MRRMQGVGRRQGQESGRAQGAGCRAEGAGHRALGLGRRAQGTGCRARSQDAGHRVYIHTNYTPYSCSAQGAGQRAH